MIKKSINSIRPIININDGITVNRMGSYGVGFKLNMNSIFTMSSNDYESVSEEFSRLFKVLPSNTIVHKMDVYYHKNAEIKKFDLNCGIDILKQGFEDKFSNRTFINHDSYLFICKTAEKYLKTVSINSIIFKKDFIAKDFLSENEKNNFFKSIEQVKTILDESKYFKTHQLNTDEIVAFNKSYESLSFGLDIEYKSEIYQDKTNLLIGTNHLSCLSINNLNDFPMEYEDSYIDPSYVTNNSSLKFSFFHPIGLDLHENHIVNQVFIKESDEKVKKNLEAAKKDNVMFAFGDKANIETIEDLNGFEGYLSKGYTPLRYHANVLLWDKDKSRLNQIENRTIAAFNKIKLTPTVTYGDTLPIYWSCYPGNIADLGVMDQTFYLLDRQASALNIYESNTESSDSDFGVMLSDRKSGVPVHVDISDEPLKNGLTNNRNKMIIGPSGSGKSFTTNVFLDAYLKSGAHVVVVDVGDSYKRLCELYDGKYFTYTEDNPLSFNPFNVPKKQRTIEKKESLIKLIFTLWKKNPDDNTRDEYKILSDSINKFYSKIDLQEINQTSFNDYYEFMKESFVPKLKEQNLNNHFDYTSFCNVLSMFYKGGEYDYLLNSNSNENLLDKQFIVFELDNIKDHNILFPVVTLMIMETFITKMRLLENTRKVILIEEAWKAITKEGMAGFMKYLYKTVRKHFGEAILVTQELDDILGNPIIENTILKNCGAKILLDMREYAEDFDKIQSLLSLNQTARELVLSLNQNKNIHNDKLKEVFIGLGNKGNVYGVNVSTVEYACYTTEKLEKEKIEKLYETHKDLKMALLEFSKTL